MAQNPFMSCKFPVFILQNVGPIKMTVRTSILLKLVNNEVGKKWPELQLVSKAKLLALCFLFRNRV